jgi:hypothetical protein
MQVCAYVHTEEVYLSISCRMSMQIYYYVVRLSPPYYIIDVALSHGGGGNKRKSEYPNESDWSMHTDYIRIGRA